MKTYLLQKAPFQLVDGRLIWGVVLCQRQGISLLYVKAPDEHWQDSILCAVLNPEKRCYEAANRFVFPLEAGDLESIGGKLQALGDSDSEDIFRDLFKPEDLF